MIRPFFRHLASVAGFCLSLPAIASAQVSSPPHTSSQSDVKTTASEGLTNDSNTILKRGDYLARAGDCLACHRGASLTAPLYAGGFAIASPMGTIISPNISPSKTSGIGNYSEQEFARAIRKGIRKDGAYLYPAMPYTAYAGLTDQDVHALYTYFMQGVAPVDQKPAATTKLAFPFNIRLLMSGWNLLFLHDGPFKNNPKVSDQINRGRYLVDNLAHCSTCHSPRNFFMAESRRRYMTGALVSGWYAPNITPDETGGIGSWSEEEIATYLNTGHVAGKAQAAGNMAEAIEYSLRFLSAADVHAMAAYLKTITPQDHSGTRQSRFSFGTQESADPVLIEPITSRTAQAMTDSSSTDGQMLYMNACASCHGRDGQGTADHFYPSLNHNSATGGITANNLIMAILNGVSRKTNDETVGMPAYAGELKDDQIVAVSNYVLDRFGNKAIAHVTASEVADLRANKSAPALLMKLMPWFLSGAGFFILVVILLGCLRLRKHSA
ncbi:Gluconate 2-dehydrogenase (acceptor) [Zymomonas mobilis subsp. pomaceae ATCC 29192]|uniref:Gluconate 2-dehydrogenase (Acceptor) n=2 Tax=Zymomonas mobilis TaxID=542 RepID=F8EVF8_ZYMMT|nr:Gluconate 2-dehydrogenase (acceptor) [Zymomonas mobilis subsp. pomaceae ATCC 29192]